MHTNLSAAIAAASLLFVDFATAASPSLMSLDTDRDGFVVRDEFTAALRQRFDTMDSDRSGRVSKSELRGFAFRQMTASIRDPLFASAGGSRPGKPPFEVKDEMDFESFSRDLMRMRFDTLDRDRDGRLSVAEAVE
jgi:Ca2+-binding EF-hand superfamily protein